MHCLAFGGTSWSAKVNSADSYFIATWHYFAALTHFGSRTWDIMTENVAASVIRLKAS
jgi:hypothetical protein